MPTNTTAENEIHPLHVVEDLWNAALNPEKAPDAEDRSYRADSLTVLLEVLRRDHYTVINELERLQQRTVDQEQARKEWEARGWIVARR